MIAAACFATGPRIVPRPFGRGVAGACCGARPAGPAPRSAPRRLKAALQDFLGDGVPAPAPALAADAARGFAAGNGYHIGGMVDRFI